MSQQQQSSMSSPPSPLVWFLLLDSATGEPYKGTSADNVSVASSGDVADFREAVYLKNSSLLTGITSSQLLVYKNKAAFDKRNAAIDDGKKEPLDPTESLDLLGSNEGMLIVAVPSLTSSSLKPFRQKRYKAMSVEASCRRYLDAIALKLASLYEFDYKYDTGPTIGDVLAVKDGVEDDDWSFRRARKNYQRLDADFFMVEIRKGQPLTNVKLPDIYTTDEWESMKKFNYNASERILNGSLPSLSNGRPYIVIPHAEFTPEMISLLKTIGVKAKLFHSPDVLEIKDEDVFL
ncbi:hypothetical protein HDU67_000823 [Dinochytrium kinnereticum]|nr:hypothetical protein HDU67_000823 [Dinochytrium kinnereticum]